MDKKTLISKAKKIPHMGAADIGDKYFLYASKVSPRHNIVECGVWFGSGTAFLAIGANPRTKIYAYDHFMTNSSEVVKLKKYGLKFKSKYDTLPDVKKILEPFNENNNIILKKSDLLKFKWNKKPIGLYVDDVSKRHPYWNHVCKTFLPYVVEGGHIILMDFYFYKKTGRKAHKTQLMFMNRHKEYFKMIYSSECKAIFKVKKQYMYDKRTVK